MAVFSFSRYFREQWCTIPQVKAGNDITSKTFIVTGSNVGLGFEASVCLAKMRPKLLVATGRNKAKCDQVRKSILERTATSGTPATELCTWPLELGSFQDVRSFADKFARDGNGTLNAVVANAGMFPGDDYTQTQDGWEVTLQVNYLSNALLCILLLPHLINSATPDSPSRLVVVSSFSHFFAPELRASDSRTILETINEPETGNSFVRYQLSKLLGVIFIRELASRLSEESSVIACVVDPGFCDTDITRNQASTSGWLFYFIKKLAFVRSIEAGSRTLVHAAVSSDRSMHGRYLSCCEVADESGYLFTPEGKACSARVWDETITYLSGIDGRVSEIVDKYLRPNSSRE